MDNRDHDAYLDIAYEQLDNIFMIYRRFEDKRPVMLYDIQEQRIYAYPYEDFKNEMAEKSQSILKEQYQEALKRNQIVVFIWDNDSRRLVSYSFDNPESKTRMKKNRKGK